MRSRALSRRSGAIRRSPGWRRWRGRRDDRHEASKPSTLSDAKPVSAPEVAPPKEPAIPPPAAPRSEPAPPKRSRGALRALLALALLAAGVIAGYQLWLRDRKPEAAPAPAPEARALLQAPPTSTPEQAAVVATIDNFLHAVSAGNTDAVKSVWPTAPPGTLEAWGSTLSAASGDGPRMQMQAPPEVTGRSARLVAEVRSAPSTAKKYTFTLRKRGEEWQISSVR